PACSAASVIVRHSPFTIFSIACRTRFGIFLRRSIGRWSAGLSIGVMSRGMPLLRLDRMRDERRTFCNAHNQRRGVDTQNLCNTTALALPFPTSICRPLRHARAGLLRRSIDPGQAAALAGRKEIENLGNCLVAELGAIVRPRLV